MQHCEEEALHELKEIIRAPGHDAVDAYASAWIASLEESERTPLGTVSDNDVIWIPKQERRHKDQ